MAARAAGNDRVRLGEAAEMLGVSPDTVRRWTASGRLPAERTAGGQRTVSRADVARLAAQRRREGRDRAIVAQSARNRFPGIVIEVRKDTAAAAVEVLAGSYRLVSLITRESADELELAPGKEVICVVKATDVMVNPVVMAPVQAPRERMARAMSPPSAWGVPFHVVDRP